MIYRIHHNEAYLMHVVPPTEAMKRLGEQHGTFAFNAAPIKYQDVWVPLHIQFSPCTGSKAKTIPDISENFGRLFLSSRAYEELKRLLESCGEFLPVTYNGGKGYLFNPLLTAEKLDAIDKRLTVYDSSGNLENFGFIQAKLNNVAVFKTQLDTFKGVFCSAALKQAVERAGLTGVAFNADVSNPIGESYGSSQ